MKRIRLLSSFLVLLFLFLSLTSCSKITSSIQWEDLLKDPLSTKEIESSVPLIQPIELTHLKINPVQGESLASVEEMLRLEMFAYEVSYVYSDEVEEGYVISSSVDSLLKDGFLVVPVGEIIELTVSQGPKPQAPGKVCYITFDDGPKRDTTDEVLQILQDHNAVATFFLIGENISYYPYQVSKIEAAGSVVGCHSYSHDRATIYSSVEGLMWDIQQWLSVYEKATGHAYDTMLFRFPYGSTAPEKSPYYKREVLIDAAHQMGFSIFDWDALNNDRALNDKPADMSIEDYLHETFLETVHNVISKDRPLILLFHETSAETRGMLGWMIDYLADLGFGFDTLDHYDGEFKFRD